ncbi:MAG: FHA domain-containing protein, partial [Cyanobacteria bacterium P01_F01_bin.3]
MSRSSSPTVLTGPYIELNNQGQLLRFDLVKDVHRLGRDRGWADLVIPEDGWSVISGRHIVLQREGEQYRILDGDGRAKPSTNGLFIKHTRVQTQPGLLLNKNAQLQIGQNPQNMILLNYVLKPNVPTTSSASQIRLNLRTVASQVALGRDLTGVPGVTPMTLDAPSVSRHHASVVKEGPKYVLRDRSTNGTYLNRKRITTARTLQDGDIIQIGPFTLL